MIGTDGEKALIDAFKHEFGFAQHLTCFIHVRRNIKDKLLKCNLCNERSLEILDDIFGKKVGIMYVEGLVDSCDAEFEENVEKLISKWSIMSQTSRSDLESFIDWFRAHKVNLIKESMVCSVREDCGLGSPPVAFTTNACEAANSVLKKKVNYKRNELPEFVRQLRELVDEQDREVERALIGRGKYELRSQYQSWQLAESKWFNMSTEQRGKHLNKFANATLQDIASACSDADTSLTSSLVYGREIDGSLSLSVEDFSASVRVPKNCLEGIWCKAAELLKSNGAIVPAPGGAAGAKSVLSYGGKKPHLVVPKKGGAFSCDEDCPNWKALGICAHTVATAEMCKKLPQFIEWYKKSKKSPSLSKFVAATMPKGRGNKGGVPPRKRKSTAAVV